MAKMLQKEVLRPKYYVLRFLVLKKNLISEVLF